MDGLKFDVDIVLLTVTGGAIVVVLDVVVTVVVEVDETFLAVFNTNTKDQLQFSLHENKRS